MRHPVPDITPDEVSSWFETRLPEVWCHRSPAIIVDDDEILVVLVLPTETDDDGADPDELTATRLAAIRRFREESRDDRRSIAGAAEGRFYRKVSWGVRIGDTARMFTHLSMPTMTRLRIRERLVLDTLIEGGVARSRSDALAWCVRMVERNLDEWITELREAVGHVDEVRRRGPTP